MFENDHQDLEDAWLVQKRGYAFCWAGFSVLAAHLVVQALYNSGHLYSMFVGERFDPGRWLKVDDFDFYFQTFRTWSRLLAASLLAAAWSDSGWRRRSGVFLAVAAVEIILWGMQYSPRLGLGSEPGRHEVFRYNLSQLLGCARFFLIVNLASDFGRHLGVPRALDLAKTTRGTATITAFFWAMFMLQAVNWRRWPLANNPMTLPLFSLYRYFVIFVTITSLQASLLVLLTSRSAGHAFRDMRREETEFDPWADNKVVAANVTSTQHRAK